MQGSHLMSGLVDSGKSSSMRSSLSPGLNYWSLNGGAAASCGIPLLPDQITMSLAIVVLLASAGNDDTESSGPLYPGSSTTSAIGISETPSSLLL